MAAWPPAAKPRMRVDVLGPIGGRRLQDRPEHSVRPRQWAEGGHQLVAHPRDEEPAESTLPVGNPQRRVARAGELPGTLDEPLQDLLHR